MLNKILISGLSAGLVYAGIMALFNYAEDEAFNLNNFIINFLFFGIFMALLTWFNLKRQEKKNKDSE